MSVDAVNKSSEAEDTNDMVGIVPKIPYICAIYTLVALGLVGNTMLFVLMQHSWFRKMSYSVYLRCLAVSDTIFLLCNCTEDILHHQFDLLNQFIAAGLYVCVPWGYVKNVSRYTSPWLIVALTVDRYVVIVMPLKRSIFCSLRTARAVCAGIFLYAMLETIVTAIHESIVVLNNGTEKCEAIGDSVFQIYINIRVLLESIVPCFFILVLNILTLLAIRRSYKFRQAFFNAENESRQLTIERATASLIAVSFLAFCTLGPQAILEVIEYFWTIQYDEHVAGQTAFNVTHVPKPSQLQLVNDVWPLLNLISSVNFCQNFYIMVAMGPRYRAALQSVLCKGGCCRGLLKCRHESGRET